MHRSYPVKLCSVVNGTTPGSQDIPSFGLAACIRRTASDRKKEAVRKLRHPMRLDFSERKCASHRLCFRATLRLGSGDLEWMGPRSTPDASVCRKRQRCLGRCSCLVATAPRNRNIRRIALPKIDDARRRRTNLQSGNQLTPSRRQKSAVLRSRLLVADALYGGVRIGPVRLFLLPTESHAFGARTSKV